MPDLVQRALTAKRESKYIEFKETFDPNSGQDWCEIIKDIVAIANSGGGIIVFGLDDRGNPVGSALDHIAELDPADLGNKIVKYAGPVLLEFEIRQLKKGSNTLQAFVIQGVSIPIIFQKPGTYDIGGGKQRSAFSVGTVYFRHGAKSEPGTTDDIRLAIERQLEFIRKSWIKGVRKVVQAPRGSQVVTIPPTPSTRTSPTMTSSVRVVNDPDAIPVRLTRDVGKAVGTFVHEEVSEGIFDEINNVIDANRALAKGQQHFFFGQPIYFRVYAERHHVVQGNGSMGLLFHTAVSQFYAPGLFWPLTLPEELVARTLAEIYLHPKSPQIHSLMRIAALLGDELSQFLFDKWHRKWRRYSQPPSFYFTFKAMIARIKDADPRLIAARIGTNARLEVEGIEADVPELLRNPQLASSLLSKACIRVFEKDESAMRQAARILDYFAYGLQVRDRAPALAKAVIKAIGDLEPGDFSGTAEGQ